MDKSNEKESRANNAVITDPRFSTLRTEIIQQIERDEFPSVTVGAIKDGKILWRESLGWADKENERVPTPETPYGIASLGKSITATAVMVLVDQGKVDLNHPVSEYLGGASLTVYEGELDQVTVRRILNMTAAVPHGHMAFRRDVDIQSYPLNALVKNRGIVVFPPGEVYLYSNFAYMVLEKLIEHVSGKSYPEYLKAEVFGPLKMKNSFVVSSQNRDSTAPVAHYDMHGTRLTPHIMVPRNSLAMYASLNDLLHYALFHLDIYQFTGGLPFGAKTLEMMHTLRGESPGSMIALGMASIDLDDKRRWLLTNGRAGGSQATLSMIPADGLAAVCLINATGQAADEIVFRICEILVPGFMQRAGQIIGEYEAWAERPYVPTGEILGKWKGFILTKSDRIPTMLLFLEDGEVRARIGEEPETTLKDVGYRDGLLSGDLISVLPMEEKGDAPHTVTISVRLTNAQLSGFATSDITNERGNFYLPAYLHLSREM